MWKQIYLAVGDDFKLEVEQDTPPHTDQWMNAEEPGPQGCNAREMFLSKGWVVRSGGEKYVIMLLKFVSLSNLAVVS
jgi:hypothetical protein